MPDIGIEVTGARALELKFEQFPQQVHARLHAAIEGLTGELLGRVTGAEPQRTGRLRGETQETVRDGENRITGRVGIAAEFAKAAALEYGAHGTAVVKAHQARLDHVFNRLVSPLDVMVAEHSRRLNIAEHAFLRRPLEAMRAEVLETLRAALDDAVAAS